MSEINIGSKLLGRDVSLDDIAHAAWLQKEGSSQGMFGSIGGLLGAFLPVILPTIGALLAPVTGGLSTALFGMGTAANAAWAGIGSGIGSYLGGNYGANQVDDYKGHFRRSTRASDKDALSEQILADAITSAATTATTEYTLGLTGATTYVKDATGAFVLDKSGEKIVDKAATSFLDPTKGFQKGLMEFPGDIGHFFEQGWDKTLGMGGVGLTGSGSLVSKGWDLLGQGVNKINPWASLNPNMIPGAAGGSFASANMPANNLLGRTLQQMNATPGVTSVINDIYGIGSGVGSV